MTSRFARTTTTPECDCRKPKPGLLLKAARDWNIDLAASYFVGDRWRDIEAGQRAGCRAIFIDYDYRERRPEAPFVPVRSLREAALRILEEIGRAGQVCDAEDAWCNQEALCHV